MRQYIDNDGNPIPEKLTIKKMVDYSTATQLIKLRESAPNPQLYKLLVSAGHESYNISKTISESQTHELGESFNSSEIHFIAMVDGKATCIRSLSLNVNKENVNQGKITLCFVWDKQYKSSNVMKFWDEWMDTESVWNDWNFKY